MSVLFVTQEYIHVHVHETLGKQPKGCPCGPKEYKTSLNYFSVYLQLLYI